jgi:hypothetical protein
VTRVKVVLFIVAALLLSSVAAKADTVLDILGVEKSINDAARRAQETGDYIAQSFAEKALNIIAEWKKANADLIRQTGREVDEKTKNLFAELNTIATRLEKGEAVTFVDMQRAMATAGDVLANAPGSSGEPTVSFYWPTIALPIGETDITIRVIGTRIADANPTISLADKMLKVKKLTTNEISFDVKRDALAKKDTERAKTTFTLDYRVSMSHWYNPFSWWRTEPRRRDLEVTMMPVVPGTLSVKPHIALDSWETKVEANIPTGGHGKDNTDSYGYAITPVDREQGWILDKEAQENASFDDANGAGEGGSHCVGYDKGSFTDNGFTFLVYHGHNTDFWGHKSDAQQSCRMWVHLKRKHHEEKDDQVSDKSLDWLHDVDVQLPDNTISSVIEIGLYTGQRFSVRSDRQIPYSLWEIFRDNDMIKLRPRPQRDF